MNHYELLGLLPSASGEEIKQRCQELVRIYHPDLSDRERFTEIVRARDILIDPKTRFHYHARQSKAAKGSEITCVHEESLPALEEYLSYWDYQIWRLNGAQVTNKRSFIRAAYRDLPNEYGYTDGDNWDRTADVLWNGFEAQGRRYIAIIWTEAQNMLESGLPDLPIIHSIFETLITELYQMEEGICIQVFLIGKGDNFPVFTGNSVSEK